ncbi:hypothetical protein B0H14DRAFT_2336819, partial [Mycena olivaceomarginata]
FGVGSGLQFLHVNGIVHGDLKQNVLVNKHGIPCICDFGISKIVTRRGFSVGLRDQSCFVSLMGWYSYSRVQPHTPAFIPLLF